MTEVDDQEDESNSDEEFDWEFEQHLPQVTFAPKFLEDNC